MSGTSGYYQDGTKRRQKMTIPKWAKVVIPSRVAKSKNSGNDAAAVDKSKSIDDDDLDQSLSSRTNRRRSSRLSSSAAMSNGSVNNDIATTTKGHHNSNNSSLADEELIWRQWYYRLYVMKHIEDSMISSLERLFEPWMDDLEEFLTVHTVDEEDAIAVHDADEDEEHDQQSLSSSNPLSQPPSPAAGKSSNKKPRLEEEAQNGDDSSSNDDDDLERKKKLDRDRLIEQFTMVPSTTYCPHLLPIIILHTTTTSTANTNASHNAALQTQTPYQQTSILDRHCLMNYFVYRWKQLHTNTTATVTLSLDMLSSTSNSSVSSSSYVSLHDVVYAILVQCIHQETNPALKQYLQHKLKKHQTSSSAATSSRQRQMRKRERSFSDLLFTWAKYTTTYTNIVVCFHDFGTTTSSGSCRKLRSDIVQLFTSWRSGEYYFSGAGDDDGDDCCCCLPISLVLFDNGSFRDPIPGVSTMNSNNNNYFYNPHDFLATSSSSCQGLDGIKIKHVSLSCNDWLNNFWISYNGSGGGGITTTPVHHLSNTILKRLQDDYYIHHKSVYELLTQLKHVAATELSSKGTTGISHWCRSLMATSTTKSSSMSNSSTPKLPTTNWQAGLFVWFSTYVSAKKYVLSPNNSDDGHDDDAQTMLSISTGRDLFQYYETMKKTVCRKYSILLSIVTWLIDNGQINSPMLLLSQQQQPAEQQTANLPSAQQLLQSLGRVRNLLLLSINDEAATSAAVGKDTSNGTFLNTYLNRKEQCLSEGRKGQLDSNVLCPTQTNTKSIIDSIIVDKIESFVNTANELIVLVDENQKHNEEDAKIVETNKKYLYIQWQELGEQIQNIVDKLGLFLKRHPNASSDDAEFYDSLSAGGEENGILLSSTACESLVAHNMRHELVEAAIYNVPEKHYLTTGASRRGKRTHKNIPISEVPGILMRALLLKDRITIPREEWFELFCNTAWETIPDLDTHKNPERRQQLADLFVCGTWYLVHSGFVQEKVQNAPASEQGRRSGMIVVYEKTSLVWCSGAE